jgi:hypothetical protein
MKLKDWARLDLFSGIDVFLDWCQENNLDHKDPNAFEQFKKELEAAE